MAKALSPDGDLAPIQVSRDLTETPYGNIAWPVAAPNKNTPARAYARRPPLGH